MQSEEFQEAMDFILAEGASHRPVFDTNPVLLRKAAEWCGGEIKETDGIGPGGARVPKALYIQLDDDSLAFGGDIIVRNGDVFKVFKENFYHAVQIEAAQRLEVIQKIKDLVIEAMVEMREETKSNAGKNMNDVAEEITLRIIEIMG